MSKRPLTPDSRIEQIAQWTLPFTAVALALWAVTQYQAAPQLILLGMLIVITLNFSLPPQQGGGGLVPVMAVSGLLMMGLETAIILYPAAFVLAELTRPLWASVWEDGDGGQSFPWRRIGQGAVYLLPLLIGGIAYQQMGGIAPLPSAKLAAPFPLGGLVIGYGAGYFLLSAGYWVALGRPFPQFFTDAALANIAYGFLALPVAILGSLAFLNNGLPAFVVFALGVTVFSVVIRLSWQRRLILEQRLKQFKALNQASRSLRETLDLAQVLQHAREQIHNLVPADKVEIILLDEQSPTPNPQSLDDFTHWVVENGRLLDLDRGNMHFAARHNLTPPTPTPNAWLGIPLMAAERVIGAWVLQRLAPGQPFAHWNRELLLAMAG
ncbi:MAG: hypothetical protein GY803_18180, partial [Chloroflexi bacterium]|nr:hypothetical protein [Chloroflexota bacterium]